MTTETIKFKVRRTKKSEALEMSWTFVHNLEKLNLNLRELFNKWLFFDRSSNVIVPSYFTDYVKRIDPMQIIIYVKE